MFNLERSTAPVGRGKSFLAYELFKDFVIAALAATFVKSPKNKFGWKIETLSRKQLFLTGSLCFEVPRLLSFKYSVATKYYYPK